MATEIYGTAVDDILAAGEGDQVIFAAGGKDTVVFTGSKDSYSYSSAYVSGAGATVSIMDMRAGSPDGADTIHDAEHLQFSDMVIDLSAATPALTINHAPVFLFFSGSSVSEFAPVGTVLGTLNALDIDGDAISFTMTNDADGFLRLDGDSVVLAAHLDYQTSPALNFSIKAIDAQGASIDRTFDILVLNEPEPVISNPINHAPILLDFSGSSVSEVAPVGTVIGSLRALDIDGDAVSYVLTNDAGGLLKIDGETIVLAGALDYETFQHVNFSVKAVDAWGESGEMTFFVPVLDEPDITTPSPANTAPHSLAVDTLSVAENLAIGTAIGRLSAVDAEGDALVFALVGDGGEAVRIDGDVVTLVKPLDFETARSLDFVVKVSDTHGAEATTALSIGVTDVVETFRGTAKADTISGDIGEDRLFGFAGNDRLSGGKGKDHLEGGLGGDKLFGGLGADTFAFTSVKDSTGSGVTRDSIFDFSGKEGDRIDLSKIDANAKTAGNQAFTYIGTAAFHGKAGEMRFEKQLSDTIVYADTNGDKKADLVIHFDDAIALQKGYFLL